MPEPSGDIAVIVASCSACDADPPSPLKSSVNREDLLNKEFVLSHTVIQLLVAQCVAQRHPGRSR